jgi:hypothetical protein
MLNRALRTGNVDIIITMGFFIRDLHRQIENLYKKQLVNYEVEEILTLYRGEGLSKDDFEQIKKKTGWIDII